MTDTNDARERWQATLQALNARKPYAETAGAVNVPREARSE